MKIFNEANNPSAVARNISSVVKNAHRNILVLCADLPRAQRTADYTTQAGRGPRHRGSNSGTMQNTSPDYASVLVTKRRADKARTTEAPAKRAVGHAEEADRTRPAGPAQHSQDG